MEYKLIRSFRKSLAIQIKNQQVIVRAPKLYPKFLINQFIKQKLDWIREKLREKHYKPEPRYISKEDYTKAKIVIEKCVKRVSQETGLKYIKLKFSNAKSYWGYCKHDNTISINWRLAYGPKEIMEYVVIHELAHTVHKNQSKKFWDLVEKQDSNYKQNRSKLKEISPKLQAIQIRK